MMVVLEAGDFKDGGINFDAKLRRNSSFDSGAGAEYEEGRLDLINIRNIPSGGSFND